MKTAAIKQILSMSGQEERARKFELSQLNLGASIENQHLQAALVDRLASLDGKTEIIQNKVTEIKAAKSDFERPSITLDDGTEISPKLLIGSDGEKSMTRQ